MKTNIIYNEDCKVTMNEHIDEKSIDIILTSPPYNTARSNCDFHNDTKKGRYTVRYVDFNDNKTYDEYRDWTIGVFKDFDRVLKKNGVILYNMSYGKHTHGTYHQLIGEIIANTCFTMADIIVWEKPTAVPNAASPNKLTRKCEFVYVFVRKDEYNTFNCNKKVVSRSKGTGQKNYENIYNIIRARNNDGPCSIHKATYSTDLCEQLLKIYGKEGYIIYDPFIGIGTTALAAINLGMECIGSEIYNPYVDIAKEKLNGKRFNKNE